MLSPIERDYQKKRTEQHHDHADLDLQDLPVYDQTLLQLHSGIEELSRIKSLKGKQSRKAELLEDFTGYIEGALSPENTRQDDILIRLMIWNVDVAADENALSIAEHAIRHGWVMPDSFRRDVATFVVEEISEQVIKAKEPEKRLSSLKRLEQMLETLGKEAGGDGMIDMLDEVLAKLYRATAEALLAEDKRYEALEYFERALEANSGCGVKSVTKKLRKEIAQDSPV